MTIDPCTDVNNTAVNKTAESIYILTRGNKGRDNEKKIWCVGQAIVAGERDYPADKLKCDTGSPPNDIPAVIIDFNMGWLKTNKDKLTDLLRNRTYIIRTHDPCKNEWKNIRRGGIKKGIWFSPIQDMADGSLWFPGNWESLHERLLDYLQTDETLWQRGEWLHYVVIQISYDGALVVGPGLPEQGELLIFKGDQPDSFSREGHGTVVAGGVVFVYSLAQTLLSSQEINPNPVVSLNSVETNHIIAYSMKPPDPGWDTACAIVCGNEEKLRERTVFRLGNLITASPEYAHLLLRLTSRLNNHINNKREVLSIALFGGPGSGKSFVAKQIAGAIDPSGSTFNHKTFNLSQFNYRRGFQRRWRVHQMDIYG